MARYDGKQTKGNEIIQNNVCEKVGSNRID